MLTGVFPSSPCDLEQVITCSGGLGFLSCEMGIIVLPDPDPRAEWRLTSGPSPGALSV